MKHRIEFIGLPGSGKSSLYDFAYRFLAQHYPKTYNLKKALRHCEFQAINLSQSEVKSIRKAFLMLAETYLAPVFPYSRRRTEAYLKFALDNTDFINLIFATLSKANMSFENKIRISNWFFAELSAYQMIDEYFIDDGILLLDEGFCHRSISLVACDQTVYSTNLLDNYFNMRAFIPDILFVVKRNFESCLNALRKKGLPDYFAVLNPDELYERFVFFGKWLEDVIKKASNLKIEVIEIENTNDLNNAKKQIKEYSNSLVLN
jgi:hypothetical protein